MRNLNEVPSARHDAPNAVHTGRQDNRPHWNERFLTWSTFRLGAHLGVLFPALYLAELILLILNPYDVMSPTESRYLFYHRAAASANNDLARRIIYDLGCWLLDHKKLIAYALFSLWFIVFACIISGNRVLRWRNRDAERRLSDLLATRSGRQKVLPFWINLMIAGVFTTMACGAATSPWPNNWTSILRILVLDPLSWNPAFLLYRAFYPLLFLVCSLHFVIGLQVLARESRRRADPASRHFYVILQFLLIAIPAEYLVVGCTRAGAGSIDEVYFNQHWQIPLLIMVAVAVAILVLYIHVENPLQPVGQHVRVPKPKEVLKDAAEVLPVLCLVPFSFVILPLGTYLFYISSPGSIVVPSTSVTPYIKYLGRTVNPDPPPGTAAALGAVKRTAIWMNVDNQMRAKAKARYIAMNDLPVQGILDEYDKTTHTPPASSPAGPRPASDAGIH